MIKRKLKWTPIICTGSPSQNSFPSCSLWGEIYRMVKIHNSTLVRKPGVFIIHLFLPYYNMPLCEFMDNDWMDVCQRYPYNKTQIMWVACFTTVSTYLFVTCLTVSMTTAFTVSGMVDWIRPFPSRDVSILIPGTYQYINLHANKNKLRFLIWEDYPGLWRWANVSKGSLKEGSKKVKHRRKRWDKGMKVWNDTRKGPWIK